MLEAIWAVLAIILIDLVLAITALVITAKQYYRTNIVKSIN